MKRFLYILGSIIVAIAAYMVGHFYAPRHAEAPGPDANATSTASTPSQPDNGGITPLSIVSIHETASSAPMVTIEYPQFKADAAVLNEAISSSTLTRLAQFRQEAAENDAARRATGGSAADLSLSAYSFIASWQSVAMNSRYASLIMRYDSYTGGANELQEVQTFDYDIAGHRMLSLSDLFPGVPTYLQQISKLARQQLTRSLSQASNGNVLTSMLDEGTSPIAENFSNFTFTDDTVTIYFPKYAVAPGAFGEQHVVIARSAIK